MSFRYPSAIRGSKRPFARRPPRPAISEQVENDKLRVVETPRKQVRGYEMAKITWSSDGDADDEEGAPSVRNSKCNTSQRENSGDSTPVKAACCDKRQRGADGEKDCPNCDYHILSPNHPLNSFPEHIKDVTAVGRAILGTQFDYSGDFLLNLPKAIISMVLSRLPMQTISAMREVCHRWKNFIDYETDLLRCVRLYSPIVVGGAPAVPRSILSVAAAVEGNRICVLDISHQNFEMSPIDRSKYDSPQCCKRHRTSFDGRYILPSLTHLNASHLGNVGSIADLIGQANNLQFLDISFNELTDAVLDSIKKLVPRKPMAEVDWTDVPGSDYYGTLMHRSLPLLVLNMAHCYGYSKEAFHNLFERAFKLHPTTGMSLPVAHSLVELNISFNKCRRDEDEIASDYKVPVMVAVPPSDPSFHIDVIDVRRRKPFFDQPELWCLPGTFPHLGCNLTRLSVAGYSHYKLFHYSIIATHCINLTEFDISHNRIYAHRNFCHCGCPELDFTNVFNSSKYAIKMRELDCCVCDGGCNQANGKRCTCCCENCGESNSESDGLPPASSMFCHAKKKNYCRLTYRSSANAAPFGNLQILHATDTNWGEPEKLTRCDFPPNLKFFNNFESTIDKFAVFMPNHQVEDVDKLLEDVENLVVFNHNAFRLIEIAHAINTRNHKSIWNQPVLGRGDRMDGLARQPHHSHRDWFEKADFNNPTANTI